MKTVCAVLLMLSAGCSVPAWADGETGQPALRLPGEPGSGGLGRAPRHAFRLWASDLSDRLSQLAPQRLPALGWRAHLVGLTGDQHAADHSIQLERTRTALTAHWRPWTLGAWKLGASMGLTRALPTAPSGSTGFAAMPMATYEHPHYRVNLGLLAPRGEGDPALILGLTVPLR